MNQAPKQRLTLESQVLSKKLEGVKQGDILSALPFRIVIAAIIWKSESDCQSVFSIGGKHISNLTYANDIALVNTA